MVDKKDIEQIEEIIDEEIPSVDLSTLKEFDKSLLKKFGKQYTGFTDTTKFESVKRVSLDCISLNNILGGGLPVGRMIEVFGDTGSCKTSFSNYVISNYQRQGLTCMYIDVEHSIDPDYMSYCGVDVSKLCIFTPDSAEEALEAARTGMKYVDKEGNPVLHLIIIDSIAALVPSGDLEDKKEMGTTMIGSLARLLSNALKQLITLADANNITLLCLNQERSTNIGGYGPKSTSAGGRAVQYYSSIRLDLNRTSWIEQDKQKLGQMVSIQTVKNKTHTPFKITEVPFIFPVERNGNIVAGLDVFTDTVNLAIDKGLIIQAGAWFEIPSLGKKVAGLKKVYEHYLEHNEEYENLRKELLK